MSKGELFHRLFEAQADRTPDHVAIVIGDEYITYRELEARANRLANLIRDRHLRDTGRRLERDALIGLCSERGAETIAGVLGILKAGAAWVPLDPDYPVDRLTYMLADSAARFVVVQERHLERHAFLGEGRGILPAEWQLNDALAAERPENINEGHDLACTVYTSGSTGRPKGVEITHAGMLSRFRWMWHDYPFTHDEVCCAKTSLNFVDSIWEMLGGLLQGVPTVVADNTAARDPGALLHLLERHGITRLVVVPALAAALLEEAARTGTSLASLRFLTFSGEPLASELARAARALNNRMTILNLYGATETAADATFCEVSDSDLEGSKVPIGRPVGAMRAYVLDEDLRPVEQGKDGELFVSGPGLARGYRNLQGLTAEKFIANPFSDPNSADDASHRHLFRTGDMVCERPNGSLDYIGRKDFQIKIRGMRIEPGEIEAVLQQHPGVSTCAVTAVESGTGARLAAFYVPVVGAVMTPDELRDFVGAVVADYMVPSLFIAQDALPLLPNGKLDRRSLTVPDNFHADTHYVAPANDTEQALVRIWQEVLALERVGCADDFFEIGGDSIQAFRVAALAREAGFALVPQDIKDAPTVAELAHRAEDPSRIEVDHDKATGEMPLSPMQRYYFTWAKPNPHKFNVGFIARLDAPMDMPRLAKALRHVVAHHDALRLRFRQDDDGIWHQRFVEGKDVYEVPIHDIELPKADEGARLTTIEAHIDRFHDTLDIGEGPVMAVGLFRGHAPGEHHFFLVMHELVTDAMSLQITLEDLQRAYRQLSDGDVVALPAKTTSFRQWVDKVIAYARNGAAREQWNYWLAAGREVAPFPEDDPQRGALQSDIEASDFEVLNAGTVAELRKRFRGGFQARLLDGIFTSLVLTAQMISGQRNLIFHKVAHGRETVIRDADVSRTVGWFITHTPITFRLPDDVPDLHGRDAADHDDAALQSALAAVSAQRAQIPDNGLGHSALRYFSDDPRVDELARYDEVRTLFQFIGDVWEHNYTGDLFRVPHPSLIDVPDTVAAENQADYHLHVYAYLMDGAFRVKLFYTRINYREETIRRIAALFTSGLQRVMAL